MGSVIREAGRENQLRSSSGPVTDLGGWGPIELMRELVRLIGEPRSTDVGRWGSRRRRDGV